MKIKTFSSHPYAIMLTHGKKRRGVFIHLIDSEGNHGWGEIAPLPPWSQETLEEALQQLEQKKEKILAIEWTFEDCLQELEMLNLFPSLQFGVESALFSILDPVAGSRVSMAALFMGSKKEILSQAKLRKKEGYRYAKLKVNNLDFEEAHGLIVQLKDVFRLRIDVNRAWNTEKALPFFAKFPFDAFDYVEEPFANPSDLPLFSHPLAIDESFPSNLSLEEIANLPTLKALIYKPTIQGGMLHALPLHKWTKERGIEFILSSSFESDVGLAYIGSMASRLALANPVGLGTYHYLAEYLCEFPLQCSGPFLTTPSKIIPRI